MTDDGAQSPLRLSVSLQDRVIAEGVHRFNLPTNAFENAEGSAEVDVEATLSDGSALPDYISFDGESGEFTIDADAAREAGVDAVEVRVTGRDNSGNVASGTFNLVVAVEEADQEGDENDGEDESVEAFGQELEGAGQSDGESESGEENPAGDEDSTQEVGAVSGEGTIQEQLRLVSRANLLAERDQLLSDLLELFGLDEVA